MDRTETATARSSRSISRSSSYVAPHSTPGLVRPWPSGPLPHLCLVPLVRLARGRGERATAAPRVARQAEPAAAEGGLQAQAAQPACARRRAFARIKHT